MNIITADLITCSMTYTEAISILQKSTTKENFQSLPKVAPPIIVIAPPIIIVVSFNYNIRTSVKGLHIFIFSYCVQWGADLQREHELYLLSECGQIPVFITDFPAAIKPFYARSLDSNSEVVYT